MDDNNDMKKTQKYLKMLTEFLNKTVEMGDRVLNHLEEVDYKIMDKFRPYIGPQENIIRLLHFYDVYSESNLEVSRVKEVIEGVEASVLKNPSLSDLDKMGVIGLVERLRNSQKSVEDYKGVRLVKEMEERAEEQIEKIAQIAKRAFFSSLEKLPKIPENIRKYSDFLLGQINKKMFLGEYTKKVYENLGFFIIENNFDSILQQTNNLTSYLNFIIEINKNILGRTVAHNINVGLITLMIVNLKRIISEFLAIVDKDHNPKHIPFLIQLCRNLRHSDGPIIKEIEELFVFKVPIYKLILNCFVEFFGDLELLDEPRIDGGVEKLNGRMADALDGFKRNKEVCRHWVELHGPSFGVYGGKEIGPNFSEKCLNKTKKLSEKHNGQVKYIYLINNLYVFREHTTSVFGGELKTQIRKNSQIITGLWRISIEGVEGYQLRSFLQKELDKHRKYYL
ncbi:hypothetical protein PAEPH01_2409, partial [Pancytospora epiphaga]